MDTEQYSDLFFEAKFDEYGNVRNGWNYETWLKWWWADVPKFGTRNCHTTLKR
jgi:hypothetical protein